MAIFSDIGDLVNQLNTALGREFCDMFGIERKQLASLGRVPKKGVLFVYEKGSDRDWAINEGGGTEIQYHISFNNQALEIRYGLGFNTQYVPFANQKSTIEYMQPFMNGFLKNENEIRSILPDYHFVYGDLEKLKKPQHDEYTLFGKTVNVVSKNNEYFIDDTVFNNIINDLKKQFEAYQIIFKERSNLKKIDMNIQNNISVLLQQKKQIILQGPPGTGKTRQAKDVAEHIIFGSVSDNKDEQGKKLKESEQFKLVQFHPAYTYEDFVRGIVVETEKGIAEYKTVNKILGKFAKKANESNLKGGTGGVDDFDRAWKQLVEDINQKKVTKIGTSNVEVEINTPGSIKFVLPVGSPVATLERTYELYKFGTTDLKYETYQQIVLDYLKDPEGEYKLKDFVASNKPFVLIIDEINRANLPAVLGELIYALEYRGKTVESIYSTPKEGNALEEGNALVLPNNLYIIGTMNTADRSVGHIDYAIRRRFAFVEMLPKILQGENFELEVFKKVSELFIKDFDGYLKNNTVTLEQSEHLSAEFRPEDVWLGHSYFIREGEENFSVRIQYEIIPILKEYIKDGILNQSAMDVITDLL